MIGLAGAIGGATLVLASLPTDLFGNSPSAPIVVAADPTQVMVIDGDTLRLRETIVRLQGVEAPPRGSSCGTAATDCGSAATAQLARLVRDQRVECRLRGHDPMGRPFGVCEAGGLEVNRAVLRSGWARTASQVPDLVDAQSDAQSHRRGLWAD